MSDSEKSKAQLVIVTGLVVFYFIFKQKYPALLYAAVGVGLVSIFVPFLGDLLVKGWFKLAEGLGWINSRVLLGAVFFIFLTPLAWFQRLFNGNMMQKNRSENPETVFLERNHAYTKKDLENLF